MNQLKTKLSVRQYGAVVVSMPLTIEGGSREISIEIPASCLRGGNDSFEILIEPVDVETPDTEIKPSLADE